jgi:D-amino-acid dehydrogenase
LSTVRPRPGAHVAVIGGGIVGLCTAWPLRQAGFEVTVFERHEGVALEASQGNAGVIAPGYVTPWAAPGMPAKILSYLLKAESPVLFRPTASPALWRWIARWLGECTLERYRLNKSRMQRLAFYSRDRLHALRTELHIDDGRRQGYLQLMRSASDMSLAAPAIALLQEGGIEHHLLDATACRVLEPALSSDTPLHGGLYLPNDESASCPDFARGLAAALARAGVALELGTSVTAIEAPGNRVRSLKITRGASRSAPLTVPIDAAVVAGSVDSLPLLAAHGIDLPIWPVKGYSTTLPLRDPTCGPTRALMDEAFKTAITRLPGGIRLAGTAELGSTRRVPNAQALRTLVKVGRDWFPEAADWSQAQCWVGARPMTPDGPALLGQTRVEGLFINMGHGSTGWAMAAGSGQVVADLIAGRAPAIDLDGLTLARLR